MKKHKILKSLPKTKTKIIKSSQRITKFQQPQQNQYAEKYLQFYDDIKTPSKRHDW